MTKETFKTLPLESYELTKIKSFGEFICTIYKNKMSLWNWKTSLDPIIFIDDYEIVNVELVNNKLITYNKYSRFLIIWNIYEETSYRKKIFYYDRGIVTIKLIKDKLIIYDGFSIRFWNCEGEVPIESFDVSEIYNFVEFENWLIMVGEKDLFFWDIFTEELKYTLEIPGNKIESIKVQNDDIICYYDKDQLARFNLKDGWSDINVPDNMNSFCPCNNGQILVIHDNESLSLIY